MTRSSRKARPLLTHTNGVPWYHAPIPYKWHRCRPQTTGTIWDGTVVDRCRCGAVRMHGGVWINQNTRTKSKGNWARILAVAAALTKWIRVRGITPV